MRLDYLGEALVVIRNVVRFTKQLRSMTHRAHRIANFMGNAGAQTSQRCEF